MNIERGEREPKATTVNNQEYIMRDGRRVAAASSTTSVVVNPPKLHTNLSTTLQGVAAPIPRAESEDIPDGLADRSMLQDHPHTGFWHTQFISLARAKGTVRDQIVCIPALIDGVVLRHLGNEGRAAESSPYNVFKH